MRLVIECRDDLDVEKYERESEEKTTFLFARFQMGNSRSLPSTSSSTFAHGRFRAARQLAPKFKLFGSNAPSHRSSVTRHMSEQAPIIVRDGSNDEPGNDHYTFNSFAEHSGLYASLEESMTTSIPTTNIVIAKGSSPESEVNRKLETVKSSANNLTRTLHEDDDADYYDGLLHSGAAYLDPDDEETISKSVNKFVFLL